MAASTSVINDLTTCSICLEVFDNPKSLPCLHAFCLKCLERHFKDNSPGDEVPCPLCRKEFKIPSDGLVGLQHHFFVQHLVDTRSASSKSTDEVACEVCLEENEVSSEEIPTATVYCIDCKQKLCERCSRPHKKMAGGAHLLKPLRAELEQELIQLRGSYCDKHKDEQVKLYCHDCDENICLMCSAVKHRNHNSGEILEVAETLRPRIDDDDKKVSSGINALYQQTKKSKRKALKFCSKVEHIEKLVAEAGDVIKRLVDTQVSECVVKLQSVKSDSAKQAEIVQEQIQLALVAMESFCTYSRELLDKGRPSDITRAANELHKRATELLDYGVTSAQYFPPHVTFSPADVTQLTSSQLIGKLTFTNSGNEPEPTSTVSSVPSQQQRTSDDAARRLQDETRRKASVVKDGATPSEQQISECGNVLHTLPEGDAVWGVTSLDIRLYVFRNKLSDQIEVYDMHSYRLLRRRTVPGLRSVVDIAACAHNVCTYISSHYDRSIHRVALSSDDVSKWSVNDTPACLSVTDTHSVLVSCCDANKIKEFNTYGKLLRQVEVPDNMPPEHTIQLPSGKFIACHGRIISHVHGVSLVDCGGKVVKSYGGSQGSGSQQMHTPIHLAVDRNGSVFVADHNNYRVLLLSPDLTYIREVVSREQLKWKPRRLYLDVDRRRLYVGEGERKSGKFSGGRVVVISV